MATLTVEDLAGTSDGVDRYPRSLMPRTNADASTTVGGYPCRVYPRENVHASESLSTNQAAEEEYPTGSTLWLLKVAIAGVLILGALDINIVATAVPSITNDFQTVADVGWYSSAFRLSTCAFQFLFGKAYRLFPVKDVFMLSNAIFLVSSVLCATASTSTMFVIGRAVSGLGWAGIISGCNASLLQTMPLRHRPLYVGLMCGIENIAIVSAPIIGGAITHSRGWRWCFWINLPIAGATLLIMFFFFPNLKKPGNDVNMSLKQKISQLDLVSNMLLIPALTSLFIALSWAGIKFTWSDGKVIGLLITFVVLLVAFLYNQHRRGDSAALPPRVLKHRSIVAGFIFSVFVNSVTNVVQYYLPTYYQVVRGYTPARSGYMMVPIIVGDTIGAILHGSGTSLVGYYTPFMLFSSIGMPVFAGLVTTFSPTTSFVKLILCSAALGFSTGIGFLGPQSAAQATLKTEDTHIGLAIMIFGSNFGPAVFVAIGQVIFTNQLSTNLKLYAPESGSLGLESSGLGDIVSSVSHTHRADVIAGMSKSLSQTWYLAVALGAATMVGSLMMEWRSVKQKEA